MNNTASRMGTQKGCYQPLESAITLPSVFLNCYSRFSVRGLEGLAIPSIMSSLGGSRVQYMEMSSGIQVRRARPGDIGRIAAFVTKAYSNARAITDEEVLTYFGEAGLTIAEYDGELVGLLGWQAKNLVARVTDLLISPALFFRRGTRVLLEALEKGAHELQCEVVILEMPFDNVAEVKGFWKSYGYEPVRIGDLPGAWREAALEVRVGGNLVFVKKLREDRVLHPM